jgi:hypothetical protein
MSCRVWIAYDPSEDKWWDTTSHFPWAAYAEYTSVDDGPDSTKTKRYHYTCSTYHRAKKYAKRLAKKFGQRDNFNSKAATNE